MKTPSRIIFLTAAAMLISHAAWANDCAILENLETYQSTQQAPKGAACSTFLSETATIGVSCHWDYAFRDDAAIKKADSIWETVKTCRTGQVLEPDAQVNHPDSYDLLQWVSGKNIFRVSVKDKSELGKTLVFFRFEKSE